MWNAREFTAIREELSLNQVNSQQPCNEFLQAL
jgi:hypothetical protein